MGLQVPREAETPISEKPGKSAAPARSLPIHAAILFALLLANLLLYYRTVGIGFLSVDDPDYIQNNPYIEKLNGSNLKCILTRPYAANYAPANLLSYALDIALAGGKKPAAIHLSNILWHGWVVCTVYLLAFTIRREILTATAAAALFLLHPTHVEVVAWISSRKDLVATGFAVLSMTCYLLGRRKYWPVGWYCGSLICFLLASAAKQSVLLLPLVMLAWDVLVEKRNSWQMFIEKIPFGVIVIFFGWMTWQAQPSTNQHSSAFVVAATELTNLFLLSGCGEYVLYRLAPDPAAWSAMERLGIIAGAILIWALPLLLYFVRQPIRAALGYWILLQMIPPMLLSFIVPITDRYLFLPSVGVCILLADVAAGLAGRIRWARWFFWGLLVAFAVVCGRKASEYIDEWRDPRSVWYGAHLKTKSPQVSQFLGEIYQTAGERVNNFVKSGAALEITNETRLAEAVLNDAPATERLRAEWQQETSSPRTNSVAYRDILWKLAWEQYKDSLDHRGKLSTPNLFMNRGRLLVSQGKHDAAIVEFQNALQFAQNSNYGIVRQEGVINALRAIGVAYWNMRNYKEAEQWLLKAQAVQKKSGQPWVPTLDQEVQKIKALAEGQK
jgi:4-amino-4-deoxy-L-arabinose transferase-like glycosyltransferase